MKTKSFKDLIVWQKSYKLVLEIYKMTKNFQKTETYGLSQQIRKAAISIPSNIAEGYGRFHFQENIQFFRQSRGSMYETQDHLITCLDNDYISKEKYESVWKISENAIKVVDGYIRYLKKQKSENGKREKRN